MYRNIVFLISLFVIVVPLYCDFEITDRIELSDIPGCMVQVGENDFVSFAGRKLTRFSIQNDTVDVKYTYIGDDSYSYMIRMSADSDTLLLSTLLHGVELVEYDDEGFHHIGDMEEEQTESFAFYRSFTSMANHYLFQCLHKYYANGDDAELWLIDDITNPLEPQRIQTLEMFSDRVLTNAFNYNDRYYLVEYEDVVRWCDDLETFELHEAVSPWPTSQFVIAAAVHADTLYLVTMLNNQVTLRAYIPQDDGSLLQLDEYDISLNCTVSFLFEDDSFLLSGNENGESAYIYRFQWQSGELNLVDQVNMPGAYVWNNFLYPYNSGYLARSYNTLLLLNNAFQQEATILSDCTYYLERVIGGRYLLMSTSAEDAGLDGRCLLYDTQTQAFLPYETTADFEFEGQRYNDDSISFLNYSNHIETIHLGNNGIESIDTINMPTYLAADVYGNLICYRAIENSENVIKVGCVDNGEVEVLGEFVPDYYVDSAFFIDENHLAVLGYMGAWTNTCYYYRIEEDYTFTLLGAFANPLNLYVTDTRIAPSGEGCIPVDITDTDNPLAMDEFHVPFGDTFWYYTPTYNGSGYYLLSETMFRSYLLDGDFNVVTHWAENNAYFLNGNNVAVCDGTTLLLGTLSEVPVVDDPLPPPAAPALRAWPNPFNPSTSVSFSLSQPGRAQLAVYNVRGQRVRTLVDDPLPAGEHTAVWNGRDDAGRAVASGVYLLRLQVGGRAQTTKALLLK